MDTEFKFDLQQLNNLKRNGLAAYVQRPPPDRIGWALVQGRWLPDWQPRKWVMQVDHLEVTFDSLMGVEEYAASGEDWEFDPWEHLMFTSHTRFFTEDVLKVESFFAQYTDKAEFVQVPERVNCPHDLANSERDPCPYPLWNRETRVLVEKLLRLQEEGRLVVIDEQTRRLTGRVHRLNWTWADIQTRNGLKRSYFQSIVLMKYAKDMNPLIWSSGTGSIRQLDQLPLWSFAEQRWIEPVTNQD